MGQQPPFDLPLLGRGRHIEKVEIVGVLEDLLGPVRVRRRQRTWEVGEGLPFSLVQTDYLVVPLTFSIAEVPTVFLPLPTLVFLTSPP